MSRELKLIWDFIFNKISNLSFERWFFHNPQFFEEIGELDVYYNLVLLNIDNIEEKLLMKKALFQIIQKNHEEYYKENICHILYPLKQQIETVFKDVSIEKNSNFYEAIVCENRGDKGISDSLKKEINNNRTWDTFDIKIIEAFSDSLWHLDAKGFRYYFPIVAIVTIKRLVLTFELTPEIIKLMMILDVDSKRYNSRLSLFSIEQKELLIFLIEICWLFNLDDEGLYFLAAIE